MIQAASSQPLPDPSTLVDWAIWYGHRGWHVIPLRPRDKIPITKHGLKDATVNLDQIRKWWADTPDANIGIRCGPESGLFILDIDAKNGGADSFEELVHVHGGLPETPESFTGGGGRHYLFKYPDRHVGNSAGKIAPGIDIRGEGGYFVAPPSIHENGNVYEWEASCSPDQMEVSAAPAWLLELIQKCVGQSMRKSRAVGDPILVGSRNDTLFRIGCSLRERFGCGFGEIQSLLQAMNASRCVTAAGDPALLSEQEVLTIARNIVEQYPAGPARSESRADTNMTSTNKGSVKKWDPDRRPAILLKGGQQPAIVDQAERALLGLDEHEIYQRGGVLVRPIRLEAPNAKRDIKRQPGTLLIHVLEEPYVAEVMTKAAKWRRFNKGSGKWESVDCPQRIAKAYMARKGLWNVPVLAGIIEAPTLRADGSILSEPGYDEATGLFLEPGETGFPPIAEQPNREDAIASLGLVLDVIGGFPFVEESDRSAAVSAILSGLVRKSIKTAPLHGFRAPKVRSGKTLLADCVSLFATGRPCAVISQSKDLEEERKRLLALLLAGDPIVCYDNIDRPFGGAAISQALTQEVITDRLLGVSKMVTAPTSALFLATGNNLVFEGDITSRVVLCDIDPECERPEERTFERNLYDFIPAHRGRLVAAALTILRAFHVAGRPAQDVKPWGGFEEWSNWIRAAIVWLGMPDPAEGRLRVEAHDPVRHNLRALLTVWDEAIGPRPITAKEVVQTSGEEGRGDLRAVLEEMALNRRGEICGRVLGKFLSSNEKRIEGGFRVERAGTRQGAILWRVVSTEGV